GGRDPRPQAAAGHGGGARVDQGAGAADVPGPVAVADAAADAAAPAPVGVGEVRRRAVVVAAAVGPAQEPPERPGRAPAAVGAPRGILAVPAADGRSAGKAARRHPSPGGRMHDYERSLETTDIFTYM